jgi:hypothetical protein
MVSICGLRWYKNRVALSYDMDAKNLVGGWRSGNTRPAPGVDRDGRRMLLTMAYVAASRLLLATSFEKMTPETMYDLSRTFPYHSNPKSARPSDAFVRDGWPQTYDFAVNPGWHQVTFYNVNPFREAALGMDLSGDTALGALGLDATKSYYVYDFWNDNLVGRLKGDSRLEQTLRAAEARMMSVHEAASHPQFLSTNRHIMQGYVDMVKCEWNAKKNSLEGVSKVVGGEPYKVVIAANGWRHKEDSAQGGAKSAIRVLDEANGLLELSLEQEKNADVEWMVGFEK